MAAKGLSQCTRELTHPLQGKLILNAKLFIFCI
uniref:Uncharacterized protein n=1 Tax=Anguilla anguilla TaxID=7936 RepID=A0A0E9UAZ7_ANGAN